MPAPIDPNVLTARDLQVFEHHLLGNKTIAETAKAIGVSTDTVKRTKKKPAYRQMVLDAMEEAGFGVEQYVSKLIKLTDAKKTLNVGGHEIEVDDNPVQLGAIRKVGDIYGDDAPKELGLTHSTAGSSDDELIAELAESLQERSGVGEGPAESGPAEGDAGTL